MNDDPIKFASPFTHKRLCALMGVLLVWSISPSGKAQSWPITASEISPGVLPYISVASYGAKGDGATDDTHSIQTALNAASAAGGGIVVLDALTYNVMGDLNVPSNVTLSGVWHTPSDGQTTSSTSPPFPAIGTTLLAITTTNPFITVAPHGTLEGIIILYPNQSLLNPPISYPPCIQGLGTDVTIQNMYLVNAFYEIDLATYPSDRHLVRSIYGQPLKLGINIDQCASGGRIENVHFWCFWSSGTDSQYMVPGPINSGAKTYGPNTMRAYMAANSIAIKLGHTQFETVDDIFGIGYHAGIELCPSSVDNGAPSGQFSNINFDGADCGLLVYATDPSGVHILNLNVANASQLGTTRIGIYFPTSTVDSGYVYVTGASFWGYLYEGVNWCGGGRISVTNSNFLEWLGPEAVAVASGRVILTGNIFGNIPGIGGMSKTTLNVNIGSGCDRAVITGNDFVNGLPAQIGNTLSVSYGNLQ